MAKVETRSGEQIAVRLAKREAAIKEAVQDALGLAGDRLSAHVLMKMREPKHGRVYKRGKKRVHIASAPGEYPAIDTSNLISRINARIVWEGSLAKLSFGLHDVTSVVYGAYLEFGTSKMAPRPWLRPTWEALKDDIVRDLEEAVRSAVRTR